MLRVRVASCLSTIVFCAVTAALCLAAPAAQEQPSTPPGQGYADPEGVPHREPFRDIEPVYRKPSIDDLATIRRRGTLRVGVAISDPMVMHDQKGGLIGFSLDVGRQLAEDLGVGVEFVETSWSHIIPDLLDRQFDIILSGLWVTTERALVINYSDATAIEGVYLIAGKPMADNLKTREDFNRSDVRLAVYGGTIQEKVAQRLFPRATVVRVEGDERELTQVLDGRAHAALVATFAPRVIVRSAPEKLFIPLPEPLQSTSAAAGVRKGDPDFLSFLNSWLTVYRDNGWLAERSQYWEDPNNWTK
jgi:polar amino acid transport system substrate-binding protein